MATMLPAPPPLPPRGGTTLELPKGLRFVFDDPDWVKKVLIGSGMMILGFLIIGNLFLGGYLVRIIQRTTRGEARPLPEWDDWGGLLGDGLKAVGIYFAYLIGALLPFGVVFGVMAVVLGAAGAHGGDQDAISSAMGLGFTGLFGIVWLLVMALMVYVPAAITRFALTGRFGAGFEVMENLAFLRRNLLNYALALLLYLFVSFLAQFGVLLCCVGVFPVSFWSLCVVGWGLGETARLDPTGVV